MLKLLSDIIKDLLNRDLSCITYELANFMNDMTNDLINNKEWQTEDFENAYAILYISNILYNNTNREILPLEDGIYDLLNTKYNKFTNSDAPIGAPPVIFDPIEQKTLETAKDNSLVPIITKIENKDNMIYFDRFTNRPFPKPEYYDHTVIPYTENSKKYVDAEQAYPDLVGTLDKCKFVTMDELKHLDIDDDTVSVFEKDFMQKYSNLGFDYNQFCMELKYDGVSVVAMVQGDTIVSAYSRGDTQNNVAADLTYIFGGYKFPNAKDVGDAIFGIKFECIITNENLMLLEKIGLKYANSRTGVIGVIGRKDARKYLSYLTLVPIRTSGLDMPSKQTEIEFLNKYYTSGVNMIYSIATGSYVELLFMVKKFTEEAEYMRPYMPFMYDGVVVSFTDPLIKARIGRVNSIDKWSIAIKFNASVKQTIFTGYTYSIGQNGVIIPMAHFRPVEFFGTIHNQTTAHSYLRFNQMSLRLGDIVNIEYRHDVICYITKPDCISNQNNPNPIIEFPKVCPFCGSPLTYTDHAYCSNAMCPERNMKRIINMVKKLDLKDIGEETVRAFKITSLVDLIKYGDMRRLPEIEMILGGEVSAKNFITTIRQFLTDPIEDYKLIGSIGFTSVAINKWKLIMRDVNLNSIMIKSNNELKNLLMCIKGIGEAAAETIVNERKYLMEDLASISAMENVICTYGQKDNRLTVRFTGIRDKDLEQAFIDKGFDADGNKSVTKDTNILIVPYIGFRSSKTDKVKPDCMILDINQAYAYLSHL